MKRSKIKNLHLFEYDIELCKGKKTNGKFHDYKKYIIEKPWGSEFLAYQTKEVSLWVLNLIPNGSTSLHAHKLKDTYLIPINNSVRMNLLEKFWPLKCLHANNNWKWFRLNIRNYVLFNHDPLRQRNHQSKKCT